MPVDLKKLGYQLERSEQLPILPQIAVAVLRMAANPNSNARRLEAILEQDAGLAARVLKVANSAYYGMANQARSVSVATQLLGMRTLQSIVLSVAYHQAINKDTGAEFDRLGFWRHSLAVGSIARKLAEPSMSEELYTIGLIHDVGMLVLTNFYPEQFEKVIAVAKLGVVPQEIVEQHMFGFDSSDVGALLAEKWLFGSIAETAIKHHHRRPKTHQGPAAIIALANALAHQSGMTNQSGSYEVALPKWALEVTGTTQETLDGTRAEILNVVVASEETYKIPSIRAA